MSPLRDSELPGAPARTRDDRTTRLIDEMQAAASGPRHVMVYAEDDLRSVDEALATPPPPQASLRRYLAYQVRDFVKLRASWMLALGFFGIYVLWDNYDPTTFATAAAGRPGGVAAMMRDIFQGIVAICAVGASAFTVQGIVSGERERGLQRFLFAKPIALVPYYLQKLGVAFAGVLAMTTIVTLVAGMVFAQALPLAMALTIVTCVFAAVGGLAFLLSTLVRFEGLAAIVLTMAVIPIRGASTQPGWEWLAGLRYVLPPVERLAPLVEGLGASQGDVASALAWSIAYGAVCVAGAIAVLRRRSILT